MRRNLRSLWLVGGIIGLAGLIACNEFMHRDADVGSEACSATPDAPPRSDAPSGPRHDAGTPAVATIARDVPQERSATGSARQHTFTADGADFDPVVDRSGTWLAFASSRHSSRSLLYLKRIAGNVVTQLTDSRGSDCQPAFSPDGERIAFASDRAGNWDIWVVNADGTDPQQITRDPAPELHPSWSPDGKHLAFCRAGRRAGSGEIWAVDVDSPGTLRLICDGLFPDWNPVEDKLVYQRARERGDRWFSIWTIELSGGEARYPTEIVSSPDAALITPRWSADGRRITFCIVSEGPSGHARVSDVAVVQDDGSRRSILTSGDGEHYAPAWSGDGEVYFTHRADGAETIWSMRVAPGSMPGRANSTKTVSAIP